MDDGNIVNKSGFDPIKESVLDEEMDSDRYEEEKVEKNGGNYN